MACKDCSLHKSCINPDIQPEGDINTAEILFVAEAPGQVEDQYSRPLIGDSGQLFRKSIAENGITRFILYNTVNCRPPENRTPNNKEVKACFPKVLKLIENMPNLKLIVPMGNIALRAFTGKQGITTTSGKELSWGIFKLMPLIHPATILYDHRNLEIFNEHVSRIPAILAGTLAVADYGTYIKFKAIKDYDKFSMHVKFVHKQFCYDLETNCLNPFTENAKIKIITFSVKPKEAFVLSLDGWNDLEWKYIYRDIKKIFEDAEIKKVGHNIKYDNLWMKAILNIDVKGTVGDTSLAQYTLYPNDSTDLKDMAWRYPTGMGGYEKILGDVPVQDAEGENLEKYSMMDSDCTHRIYLIQKELISKEDRRLQYAYDNLLIPLSDTLCKMECNGIRLNPPRLHMARKQTLKVIDDTLINVQNHSTIKKYEKDTESEFNINSHKQKSAILYGKDYENLEPTILTKKTKTPATSQDAIAIYKESNDLANLLYTHARYLGLEKTFKEIMENLTTDHRIHTSYWITSTRSGRSSSRDPNLQNIPKGDKDITGIRKAFVSDPGFYLAEFDFNQHELRCLAEEANDNNMREDLKGDVHARTTAGVLGISPELVTEDQRTRIGKRMNFGIVYGKTVYGLAKDLDCTEKEAQAYLDRYFLRYPNIKRYQDKTIEFVKQNGYVWLRSGFKKVFPSEAGLTDHELRAAINAPIQGLAGHILFYALIGVDRFLAKYNLKSFLALEVHDSIVMNIHNTELNIVDPIREVMCHYFENYIKDWNTPLAVDVKIGYNWGEMKKYEKG